MKYLHLYRPTFTDNCAKKDLTVNEDTITINREDFLKELRALKGTIMNALNELRATKIPKQVERKRGELSKA